MSTAHTRKPAPADLLQITVDKANFLEVGRIFKRVFRPYGAANVILTLGPRSLHIEFKGGGCDLPRETTHTLVAELTAKAFAGIMTAHRAEKLPSGTVTLTFRSTLGEFATALAGAKANFHHPPSPCTPSPTSPTR